MKYFSTLVLIVIVAAGYVEAQTCAGRPNRFGCGGGRDEGFSGLSCWLTGSGDRFYYDQNTNRCRGFWYKGCGGNNNRHCTMAQCHRNCVR
ncbi:BPTI/Kunitz domain-containing protein-like [Teleopsis dalmanni]|uniref:BPTI/Kunitz domain-containing protein-like n=1 Tax=Teleopsis dalmanni TaxID=139649 RepID=UPI000D32B9B2|nr:BPTI/Kunitz domain-containing protein-like [Teleopsis dalmanni]